MAGALDSPVRAQVHKYMAAILPWFDGEIVHYVACDGMNLDKRREAKL